MDLAPDIGSKRIGFIKIVRGYIVKVQGDVELALDFGGGAVGYMQEI